MGEQNDNPFGKLIVDEGQELNQQELADLLEPFVVFVKTTRSVDFLPDFRSLPNDLKVSVILAASKARALIFSGDEKLSPKEIINLDLMPEGSVKSSIKKLYDAKEIKAEGKKYYLPNYRIASLARSLQGRGRGVKGGA